MNCQNVYFSCRSYFTLTCTDKETGNFNIKKFGKSSAKVATYALGLSCLAVGIVYGISSCILKWRAKRGTGGSSVPISKAPTTPEVQKPEASPISAHSRVSKFAPPEAEMPVIKAEMPVITPPLSLFSTVRAIVNAPLSPDTINNSEQDLKHDAEHIPVSSPRCLTAAASSSASSSSQPAAALLPPAGGNQGAGVNAVSATVAQGPTILDQYSRRGQTPSWTPTPEEINKFLGNIKEQQLNQVLDQRPSSAFAPKQLSGSPIPDPKRDDRAYDFLG